MCLCVCLCVCVCMHSCVHVGVWVCMLLRGQCKPILSITPILNKCIGHLNDNVSVSMGSMRGHKIVCTVWVNSPKILNLRKITKRRRLNESQRASTSGHVGGGRDISSVLIRFQPWSTINTHSGGSHWLLPKMMTRPTSLTSSPSTHHMS